MGRLSSWWDRSLFNRVVIFRPKLLYHGTTLSYYDKETNKDYYSHGLREGVWFEKNPIGAVYWAVLFALKHKDKPVLVIVNAKRLTALRRNWFLSYQSTWRPPFYRADDIKKKFAVMVKLEFKDGSERNWKTLTDSCKREIARAQAKLIHL